MLLTIPNTGKNIKILHIFSTKIVFKNFYSDFGSNKKDETWTDFQKNVGHHKCIKIRAIWIPKNKKEDREEAKNNLKNNDWKVPSLIEIKH